jgi:hypothetical protein
MRSFVLFLGLIPLLTTNLACSSAAGDASADGSSDAIQAMALAPDAQAAMDRARALAQVRKDERTCKEKASERAILGELEKAVVADVRARSVMKNDALLRDVLATNLYYDALGSLDGVVEDFGRALPGKIFYGLVMPGGLGHRSLIEFKAQGKLSYFEQSYSAGMQVERQFAGTWSLGVRYKGEPRQEIELHIDDSTLQYELEQKTLDYTIEALPADAQAAGDPNDPKNHFTNVDDIECETSR